MMDIFELKGQSARDFEEFERGYIDALFFTDAGPDSDIPEGAQLSEGAEADCKRDCLAFFALFCGALSVAMQRTVGYTWAHAGHDFWLTRNGHGAGFWDGHVSGSFNGYDIAECLTDACKMAGEACACLGDDGLVHLA